MDDGTEATTQAPLQRWLHGARNTFHQLTVKRYGLPDKTVASQILMYRQLLHTSCRPNLKLSREYSGTPAQVAVRHQPWWMRETQEDGSVLTMVETGKMVISYDNLLTRLWNAGLDSHAETPEIPHEDWIHRLGFQQNDPVTDFRSGGILSLALMVWIVESCPDTYARFATGDASVLPFGITSINVTDVLAKQLLLSKRTDRMEALLSQKPFWQMFADPSAILVCQEVALDLLADVVCELQCLQDEVTVFDFAKILKITEHRIEYDLLGAGPVNVAELRSIHGDLKKRYAKQLIEKKDAPAHIMSRRANNGATVLQAGLAKAGEATGNVLSKAGAATGTVLSKAGEVTGTVLSKTAGATGTVLSRAGEATESVLKVVMSPKESSSSTPSDTTVPTTEQIDFLGDGDDDNDNNNGDDWVGPPPTFQIDDEDDDDPLNPQL